MPIRSFAGVVVYELMCHRRLRDLLCFHPKSSLWTWVQSLEWMSPVTAVRRFTYTTVESNFTSRAQTELFQREWSSPKTKELLFRPAAEIVQSQDTVVDFVSTVELSRLAEERSVKRLQQWKVSQRQLARDPRIVLHYGFSNDEPSRRLLQSHLSERGELDGAIIGCRWTEGRWPGKEALEFKHPGDRIRTQIPGEYDSLTYSAWVRIDGLDRPFSALMLTNGYETGEAHWQLRDDGRLLLGVKTPKGHVAFDSKPILNIKHLGRWTHLATVYDSQGRQVTHYIDGIAVGSSPLEGDNFKLRFGETEIGNWGTPIDYSPQKIRNFNGKIDELTLFGDALSPKEIQSLYSDGRL